MIKMAFDGITTKTIATELTNLCGARIDKVFQPDKNTIVIGMYAKGQNFALTACIDAQNYRVHLTTHPKQNPQVAPNFCMLLRKNIIGLRLKNVITFDLERIIILELEGLDDIDDIISKKLVIELMGKHSNIMLVDEQNIIQDSMRHIKETDEQFRDILPHTKYSLPSCDKKNFLEVSSFEEFASDIINETENSTNSLPSILSDIYNGFSKNSIAKYVESLNLDFSHPINSCTDEIKNLYNLLQDIFSAIYNNNVEFKLFEIGEKKKKDYFLTLRTGDTNNSPFSLNFFLDDFYYEKETGETFKNYRNTVLRLILDTLKKYQKRLYNMNEKLKECENMDTYRLYGELITTNLYQIPNKNLSEVEVQNYYENNKIVKVPLDKKYIPSVNAKRYFKKYSKLKNALEVVTKQKEETLQELDYLESIVYELESCSTLQEVSDIFEEISENVIFKEKTNAMSLGTKGKKSSKIKKSNLTKNKTVSFNPIKYKIDGYTVLVGRNNKENDYLTLKYASKNDLWFHTKDIHGSHVILRLAENADKSTPSEELLLKVASIAALHSKAKNSSNVPVDMCEVRFVKKPSGAKPGMVIYKNQQTVYVNP